MQVSSDVECCGGNGPCKYFIFVFYVAIYVSFTVIYTIGVHPNLTLVYSSHLWLHRILSFAVLPGPWLVCLALQFLDPGDITAENVKSYMAIYPYDGRLYRKKMCPTLGIPAVARSRYCSSRGARVAKYDHYCPWLLATIGERTQRLFLLFLFSNVVPSAYYAVGCYRLLAWYIAEQHVKWSDSIVRNTLWRLVLSVKFSPTVFGNMVMLTCIAVAMMFFLIQQLYYASKNITQVELDKIESWQEAQENKKRDTKYNHFYTEGFVSNWKSVLFPPVIAKHAPVTQSDFNPREFPMDDLNRHDDRPPVPAHRRGRRKK